MKKLLWAGLILTLFSVSAQAQQTPAADASVGYSYFHLGGSPGTGMNGVSGSVAYNVNNVLGAVGDLGVYHGSPGGVGLTNVSYMFGPRFSYRMDTGYAPFAQVLFGGSHLSASGSGANAFAYSMGGGVDIPVGNSGAVALRPQLDYVGLRRNGNTSNCVRLSVSLVFHIGEK